MLPEEQGAASIAGFLWHIFVVSFVVELSHTRLFTYSDVFPEVY